MSNKGNISIVGVMPFCDLFVVGGAPGFPQKFSATVQVVKNSPSEKAVFEEMQTIAQKTWPTEWEAKLAAVHDDILTGASPTDSKVSLQDGDQYQPDYNAGFWVVKPSRRPNQGPPLVFGIDGSAVHDASDPKSPQPGYGVKVLMNVWAMKAQNRINFTVIAVRAAQVGVKIGGPPPAQIAAAVEGFMGEAMPAAIPGVLAPEQQVAAGAPTNTPGAVPVPSAVPTRSAVPQGPAAKDLGLDEGGVLKL